MVAEAIKEIVIGPNRTFHRDKEIVMEDSPEEGWILNQSMLGSVPWEWKR